MHPSVLGESCITYNFENDFNQLFDFGKGICVDMKPWIQSNYSLIDIEKPHTFSESFITPDVSQSCVSTSFTISTAAHGKLEVNVYMEDDKQHNNHIIILIQELSNNEVIGTVLTEIYTPTRPNFTPGWKNLRINLNHAKERFESIVSPHFNFYLVL